MEQGIRWLRQGGRISRNKRSILISSVRSFLFNQVLSLRVAEGNWDQILDGEIAMLNGSRSVFPCLLPDPSLNARCRDFDIHPTGPLAGEGGLVPERLAALLEEQVLDSHSGLVADLCKVGSSAARRSLRLLPVDLEWTLQDAVLTLNFELAGGSYATSVLKELVSCSEQNHIRES